MRDAHFLTDSPTTRALRSPTICARLPESFPFNGDYNKRGGGLIQVRNEAVDLPYPVFLISRASPHLAVVLRSSCFSASGRHLELYLALECLETTLFREAFHAGMRAGRAPRIRLRRVTSARRDECRIGNWFGRALGLFKSFLLDGDKNEGEEGLSQDFAAPDCGQEKPHPLRTLSLKECSSAVSYGIAHYNACHSLAEMSAAFQPLVFRG